MAYTEIVTVNRHAPVTKRIFADEGIAQFAGQVTVTIPQAGTAEQAARVAKKHVDATTKSSVFPLDATVVEETPDQFVVSVRVMD